MGWQVGCLRNPALVRGRVGSGLDLFLRYPNVLGLVVTRVLVGVVIVAGPSPIAHSTTVLWLMALIVALLTLRNPLGHDGSDQMQWIVFLGAAVASLTGTPAAKTLFLWFVGLQVCLAYATAGWAKANRVLRAAGRGQGCDNHHAPVAYMEIVGCSLWPRTQRVTQ